MKRRKVSAALVGKKRRVKVHAGQTLISDEITMQFDPDKTYAVEADMGPGGTVSGEPYFRIALPVW